ncbi:UNVERIFIED_ORG: uncharacterized protein with PIN domain [Xanthobacter viscosus]|nr:type II toxin-antitoxin system VapC family toxin [Xanthobacter autotrophicus]
MNFGDPMAYAVAGAHVAPLLFKGDDLSRAGACRPSAGVLKVPELR